MLCAAAWLVACLLARRSRRDAQDYVVMLLRKAMFRCVWQWAELDRDSLAQQVERGDTRSPPAAMHTRRAPARPLHAPTLAAFCCSREVHARLLGLPVEGRAEAIADATAWTDRRRHVQLIETRSTPVSVG